MIRMLFMAASFVARRQQGKAAITTGFLTF
jgi:hypothetical protein